MTDWKKKLPASISLLGYTISVEVRELEDAHGMFQSESMKILLDKNLKDARCLIS